MSEGPEDNSPSSRKHWHLLKAAAVGTSTSRWGQEEGEPASHQCHRKRRSCMMVMITTSLAEAWGCDRGKQYKKWKGI